MQNGLTKRPISEYSSTMATTTKLNPRDLPAGQRRMYDAIRAYWNAHRFAPSVRDLMNLTDIMSPNGVMCHVKALKRKGYISYVPGLARTIVVETE